MKKPVILFIVGIVALTWTTARINSKAAEGSTFQKYEYVTIHWGGRQNTHLIRSNGKVEVLTSVLNAVRRPDRTDERAFYMNVAMNAVAKEGYEFAGSRGDDIIMERAIQP